MTLTMSPAYNLFAYWVTFLLWLKSPVEMIPQDSWSSPTKSSSSNKSETIPILKALTSKIFIVNSFCPKNVKGNYPQHESTLNPSSAAIKSSSEIIMNWDWFADENLWMTFWGLIVYCVRLVSTLSMFQVFIKSSLIWSLFHFGPVHISDFVLEFNLPYSFSSLGHSRDPESVNRFQGEHFSHFQTIIPDWLTSISSSD